jgi:hypothetical protein
MSFAELPIHVARGRADVAWHHRLGILARRLDRFTQPLSGEGVITALRVDKCALYTGGAGVGTGTLRIVSAPGGPGASRTIARMVSLIQAS